MFSKSVISNACLMTVLFCGVLLTGCSDVKTKLGLDKQAPDEFAVVRRAPLEIPPGITHAALPPPRPGMPRPQEQSPEELARETVIGSKSGSEYSSTQSSAENVLLKNAGADNIDSSVRRTVDAETRELNDRNVPVIKKLTGVGGSGAETSATVVDAEAEYERLKQNKAKGKPVTDGDTPYIDE